MPQAKSERIDNNCTTSNHIDLCCMDFSTSKRQRDT